MKKIFENPNLEFFDITDEIPNTIFAYWKGYLSLENPEALESCEFSLKYFKDNGIIVMISDHAHLEGATLDFLEWIQSYYFPTAIKNGLKSEIVLEARDLMGNVSLELMYDKNDMERYIDTKMLYTPKADTLDNAKLLAKELTNHYKKILLMK